MTYPPADDRLRHLLAQEINTSVDTWKLAFWIAGNLVKSPEIRREMARILSAHTLGRSCGDRNCEHCYTTSLTAAAGPAPATDGASGAWVPCSPEWLAVNPGQCPTAPRVAGPEDVSHLHPATLAVLQSRPGPAAARYRVAWLSARSRAQAYGEGVLLHVAQREFWQMAATSNYSLYAATEAHRLGLSLALGLGTGAPWDAIRDRAAELAPATGQAALRERLAEALYAHDHPGWSTPLRQYDGEPVYQARAAAVLAVLPAPVDQAAVLTRATQTLLADIGLRETEGEHTLAEYGRELVALLRRMADETPQPEAEAHPAEHTWRAELHDPLADEWAPGTRYIDRDRAVTDLARARAIGPTWKDGTPTVRRLVRATTTYTVEAAPAVAQPDKEA